VHRDGALAAVRLCQRGDAEVGAGLDVGHRRLDGHGDAGVGQELQLQLFAIAGLDEQKIAVDLRDGAAHAHGILRRCWKRSRAGKHQQSNKHRSGLCRRFAPRHGSILPGFVPRTEDRRQARKPRIN
jgi:hypothetical protein